MSGTSLARFSEGRYISDKVLVDVTRKIIKETFDDRELHTFGGLYNAYTEKSLSKQVDSVGRYDIPWISDSGGLQIVTTGAQITSKIKDDIYRNQATYSDVAMCFDEMPLIVDHTINGTRLNLSNRKFVVEMIESAARGTGKNIKRQLEIFDEEESNTKVMIILQGNQPQDFQEYLDYVLAEIPKDQWNRLAGIAVSAACTGLGSQEMVNITSSYCMLDIPEEIGNTFHLLGIGSISRLLPAIQFMRSGWIDAEVSYDSSSHASRFFVGGAYMGKGMKNIDYGKTRSPNSEMIIKKIFTKFPQIERELDVSFDYWSSLVGNVFSGPERFNSNDIDESRLNQLLVFCNALGSITNFTDIIDDIFKDTYQYTRKTFPMKMLSEVNCKEDFLHWKRNVFQHIDGNAISRYNTIEQANSPEGLF